MNTEQYNRTAEILASIKYVKEDKEDKETIKVKHDKENKDEKEDKQFSSENGLVRLKALAARRETESLTSSSLESLREEDNSSGFAREPQDSFQKKEGLCEGPAEKDIARFRCEYYTQRSGRGLEYKVKVLLTLEDGKYIELMSNVGRSYDFARGLESIIENDPWYDNFLIYADEKNTKCGKFYIANTKANGKKNRNTIPQPYTGVIVKYLDTGAYSINLWLWNAQWTLFLTDTFLTVKQKEGNMLAKTQWFNPDSKNNNKNPSALDMLGWKKSS